MKDALTGILSAPTDSTERHVERVLATSFFRTRQTPDGGAVVVSLAERRGTGR